jgi:hypothetical protein
VNKKLYHHKKLFSKVFLSEQVTVNRVPRLIPSVLEVSLDLFVSHVRLVLLSMIMDMGFVSHAQTNLLIPITIALLSSVTTAHINVQKVLKM